MRANAVGDQERSGGEQGVVSKRGKCRKSPDGAPGGNQEVVKRGKCQNSPDGAPRGTKGMEAIVEKAEAADLLGIEGQGGGGWRVVIHLGGVECGGWGGRRRVDGRERRVEGGSETWFGGR